MTTKPIDMTLDQLHEKNKEIDVELKKIVVEMKTLLDTSENIDIMIRNADRAQKLRRRFNILMEETAYYYDIIKLKIE